MPVRLTTQYIERFALEELEDEVILTDIITVCRFWEHVFKEEFQSVRSFKSKANTVLKQARKAADRLLGYTKPSPILSIQSMRENHGKFNIHAVKFNFLYVLAVLTSCHEAFGTVLKGISQRTSPDARGRPASGDGPRSGVDPLETKLGELSSKELIFVIGSDPEVYVSSFISETTQLIINILEYLNIPLSLSYENTHKFADTAKKSFTSWLTSGGEAATWMSMYLNFTHQKEWQNRISDDVRSIQQAFNNWVQPISDGAKKRADAWSSYRQLLFELPDKKETMIDEEFGVRQVFIPPLAVYRVIRSPQDKGVILPDVLSLIATLSSDRVAGDELIVLCGGPGSGKSTLCRIFASALAMKPEIHPIFLRLRQFQHGQDIPSFMEAQLQREGIIDKFSDLREISNLVVILDGFDELVMSSTARLNSFFNRLKDDVSSGPLRNAKVIVSGRDTLFPNGAGLPNGTHVISLLPFDHPRIQAWGEKWRKIHSGGRGAGFQPEQLYDQRIENLEGVETPPLHHLVSWPLTLHLVARVHSSGALELTNNDQQTVEKATLYQSIIGEITRRQHRQSSEGRLAPEQMRAFVQAISWEMYSTFRDSLDVSEALPLLKRVDPNALEQDLADVAIVNQPELTKGDQGGFEFVHKSFSEYFVAEKIARSIETVTHEIEDIEGNLAWRMSTREAIGELAVSLAIRPLTAEVQEMLEPMIADFQSFSSGNRKPAALRAKKSRFEQLVAEYATGIFHGEVAERVRNSKIVRTDLEAHANFAFGILALGCAISRRLGREKLEDGKIDEGENRDDRLSIELAKLWKLTAIIHAGEINIDPPLANRCFSPIRVRANKGDGKDTVDVFYPPLPPRLLSGLEGVTFPLEDAISLALSVITMLAIDSAISVAGIRLDYYSHSGPAFVGDRYFRRGRRMARIVDELLWKFDQAGLRPARGGRFTDEVMYEQYELWRELERSFGPSIERRHIAELKDFIQESLYRLRDGDFHAYTRLFEGLDYLIERSIP